MSVAYSALLSADADEALALSLNREAAVLAKLTREDKAFAYLVAQHHAIHRRLRALAELKADPADLAVLLQQRAHVLTYLADHLATSGAA